MANRYKHRYTMSSRSHFALAFIALFFIVILASAPASAGTLNVLRGHVPASAALAQPLGRLPETNSLRLAISLPLRHQTALLSLLQRLYDPASADYHHYLAPAQFDAMFGPTTQDYQAVMAFRTKQWTGDRRQP